MIFNTQHLLSPMNFSGDNIVRKSYKIASTLVSQKVLGLRASKLIIIR